MEPKIDEKTTDKRSRKHPFLIAFVLAILIGTFIGLRVASNSAGQTYQKSLKNELISLRGDTNLVDKTYGKNEAESFKQMKFVLADYSKNAPTLKPVVVGVFWSSKYNDATQYNEQYKAMLKDYQTIVDEYFSKVTKIKASDSLSAEQKAYLQEYGKRLEAIKERRRQLEEKLK